MTDYSESHVWLSRLFRVPIAPHMALGLALIVRAAETLE